MNLTRFSSGLKVDVVIKSIYTCPDFVILSEAHRRKKIKSQRSLFWCEGFVTIIS